MTPEEIDYGEIVKKKVAEQLKHFLLKKDAKPVRVQLVVHYGESMAKIDIDLSDLTQEGETHKQGNER